MKTLIVYASVHHQNTEKIAKAMAEELGADLVPIGQAQPETITAYDLIGFGSGIYAGKFYHALLRFVGTLPTVAEKQAFVFSTCGVRGTQWHAAFKELLANRGFSVVGEFSCKGWDTVSFLKLFGGINKGRPNEKDLKEARRFAVGLKEKYS
ncbi:MAG TPA: flavodoxin family protein [Candidatus Bathyarchaeia archaeon]|nr:flavodoxin family protein [Candidatus Bathyarchaeia archaeon]